MENGMSYVDFEAVDRLVHGTCASEGYVYTDRQGVEQIDEEALKDAVYHELLKSHIVSETSDMTANAVIQHELNEEILPHGPGARQQPANEVERLARDKISRKLWGFTNTGTTGYCNKRVEAEGYTLVLCEAPVGRTFHSEETDLPPVFRTGGFGW